ncbi:MAG: hypothetical protein UT55_C0053G0007 [Candidatus Peregrinibacteria bacterium GW2011_GWE2_39_6]|nr:MAG: hypothetical protein UT55_C0053G0007 [Candidatus Peregrinibacteria bacterium GW2011_GWE2_39_6]
MRKPTEVSTQDPLDNLRTRCEEIFFPKPFPEARSGWGEDEIGYRLNNLLGNCARLGVRVGHPVRPSSRELKPAVVTQNTSPEFIPIPSPQSDPRTFVLSLLKFSSRLRRWCLGAALGGALAGGVAAIPAVYLAKGAKEAHVFECAPPIYTRDPDLENAKYPGEREPVGYLYGTNFVTGADSVNSHNDIELPVSLFRKGGRLRVYYEAFRTLEDQGGGLSDVIGVNPRMLVALLFKLIGSSKGGGGSGLAEQTCDVILDGVKGHHQQNRLVRKMKGMLCGLGLTLTTEDPEEMAALHASHVPLGYGIAGLQKFTLKYWGFEKESGNYPDDDGLGIYHPEFGVEHQLLLAAMSLWTWSTTGNFKKLEEKLGRPPTTDEKYTYRWKLISHRAKEAARQLSERGLLKGKLDDICKRIDLARPKTYQQVCNSPTGFAQMGPQYAAKISSMTVTVDPNTQGKALMAAQAGLRKLNNLKLKATVIVVNQGGEAIAWYTGGAYGADAIDRPHLPNPPGSVEKIFVTAAVGVAGHSASEAAPFWQYLKLSKTERFASEAKRLGAKGEIVRKLGKCYAEGDTERWKDPVKAAAWGWYLMTSTGLVRVIGEAMTGEPIPEPHVVASYVLKGKRFFSPRAESRPGNRSKCAQWLYASGLTKEWMKAPLEGGTMDDLKGIAAIGKTGTVGEGESSAKEGQNRSVAAIAATGQGLSGVVVIASDDFSLGRMPTASSTAVPVLAETLKEANRRQREGKL